MDRQTAIVLQAITKLSPSQRAVLVRHWNEYTEGATETKTRIVNESKHAMRVDVGPLSGGCPLCGK